MFRPSGIWIAVFASAFQAAISARSDIQLHNLGVEKSQNNASLQGEAGCYCSQVNGPDECEDNKYPTKPERIDGPRFYHFDGLQKPLCCKREDTGLVNQIFGIGLTYHKQPNMSLCNGEWRAIPPASCCHVSIKPEMGIRVSWAYAKFSHQEFRFPNGDRKVAYSKTKAKVMLSYIAGAVDFDGTELSSEDTQSFLKRTFNFSKENEGLDCTEDLRSLVNDASSECKLRKHSPEECCCLSMTLEGVTVRCLPVEGAPQEGPGVIELEATLEPSPRLHGFFLTSYREKGRPEEPETAESVTMADPEIGDSFEFKWSRMQHQWTEECVEPKRVWTFGSDQVGDKEYYQPKMKEMCGRSKWTRRCPAGKTLYSRPVPIPKGQCFSKNSLVAGPALTYNCPSDYTNSASSSKCVCERCDK